MEPEQGHGVYENFRRPKYGLNTHLCTEFENFRFSHLEAKFLSRNVRRVIYRGTQKFLGQETGKYIYIQKYTNASNITSEKKT